MAKKLTNTIKDVLRNAGVIAGVAVIGFSGMGALAYTDLAVQRDNPYTLNGRSRACEIARNPGAVSKLEEFYDGANIAQKSVYPIFRLFAGGIDTGSQIYAKLNCNDENSIN